MDDLIILEDEKSRSVDGLPSIDPKVFGQQLKAALHSKHMPQKELASRLGVQEPTVSNYVNGRILPSAGVMYQISYILGKPVDFFFQRPTSVSISDLGEVARMLSALNRIEGLSVKVEGTTIYVTVDSKFSALADYLSLYLEYSSPDNEKKIPKAIFRSWNTQTLEQLDQIKL